MKILLSKLVTDYALYPREGLDSYLISRITDTIQAGYELPPIVVEKETNVIVDGHHRCTSWEKVYGVNSKIEVVFKVYVSKQERFLDAVKRNATHGRPLTMQDKTRCMCVAKDMNIKTDQVAEALSLTTEKAEGLVMERTAQYKAKIAIAPISSRKNIPRRRTVTLKNTMKHFAGKTLTKRQMEYNEEAGGLNQLFYITQVIKMIKSDSIDKENESVKKGLIELAGLFKEVKV